MTGLLELVGDYLKLRRSLGFKLDKAERYLTQYCAYLAGTGAGSFTVENAVAWATAPNGAASYHAARLAEIRQFARWARAFNPDIQVPPRNILPPRSGRAVPYLYTRGQVVTLMEQAAQIRTPMKAATFKALIGLLASTGLRVGEAIGADRSDLREGILTVRETKFGKTRLVPLHPTVQSELAAYQQARQRRLGTTGTDALFVSTAGTRLHYKNVHFTFHNLLERAGITTRSSQCRPRIHDLRHTFAVNTLQDAYRNGMDPAQLLPVLATYLGHKSPQSTYWYLEAEPGLLAEAATRLGPVEIETSPS